MARVKFGVFTGPLTEAKLPRKFERGCNEVFRLGRVADTFEFADFV